MCHLPSIITPKVRGYSLLALMGKFQEGLYGLLWTLPHCREGDELLRLLCGRSAIIKNYLVEERLVNAVHIVNHKYVVCITVLLGGNKIYFVEWGKYRKISGKCQKIKICSFLKNLSQWTYITFIAGRRGGRLQSINDKHKFYFDLGRPNSDFGHCSKIF